MNDDIAIRVEHVTKAFRLRAGGSPTLKSTILEMIGRRRQSREFLALKDVDFVVRRGETLGIIGANGAGKSTLLSLVSGTMAPTTGRISTQGTISSLLELGAGFHPDLTGRENVFLYGAVMGLSRNQMNERFDAIVEFSGIREFIDQPVKHYSSGMYVRLGFSVAVEVDPDVLLIDEVLAVGDADFQRKCLAKMEEFRQKNKTMLIISHDMKTIQSISDRILLLDDGRTVGIGNPDSMVEQYQSLTTNKRIKSIAREWGTGEVKLTGAKFFNAKGEETDKFTFGAPLEAKVFYETDKRIENPVFGFAVATENGTLIYGNNTQVENFVIPYIEGRGSITLRIKELAMSKGLYLFSFSVHSSDHKVNYHRMDNLFPIQIDAEKRFEGCCHMPCQWGR
jgi:ABC-type polysaccharide/polyol phosphate transport system ATPase subunit